MLGSISGVVARAASAGSHRLAAMASTGGFDTARRNRHRARAPGDDAPRATICAPSCGSGRDQAPRRPPMRPAGGTAPAPTSSIPRCTRAGAGAGVSNPDPSSPRLRIVGTILDRGERCKVERPSAYRPGVVGSIRLCGTIASIRVPAIRGYPRGHELRDTKIRAGARNCRRDETADSPAVCAGLSKAASTDRMERTNFSHQDSGAARGTIEPPAYPQTADVGEPPGDYHVLSATPPRGWSRPLAPRARNLELCDELATRSCGKPPFFNRAGEVFALHYAGSQCCPCAPINRSKASRFNPFASRTE